MVYCSHCRAALDDGALECKYCGCKIEQSIINNSISSPEGTIDSAAESSAENVVAVVSEETNPYEGKTYSFVSPAGEFMALTWSGSRVRGDVNFLKDRMTFDIVPKRYNKTPVIMYPDILKVEIKKSRSTLNWIYLITMFIIGFSSIAAGIGIIILIFAIIDIFTGVASKVLIYQRNGITMEIIDKNHENARAFKSIIDSIIAKNIT